MITELATHLPAAAPHVSYLADGVTFWDVTFNFFDHWKKWIAVVSPIVLCTAGVFTLARSRAAGLGLIALGVVLCGFFLSFDMWVRIFQNTEQDLNRPARTNDLFHHTGSAPSLPGPADLPAPAATVMVVA